jgi:hypothetical protein
MRSSTAYRYRVLFLLAGTILACNLSLRPSPVSSPPAPASSAAGISPTVDFPPTDTVPAQADWPPTVDEILTGCPTAAEIAEVESRIHLKFDADPTAGRMVCTTAAGSADLTREQKNAYNAVLIMKDLTFDAPLPWTDQSLYDWFTGSIEFIEFRSDIATHHCCGSPPTVSIKADLHIYYSDRWTAVGSLMRLYVHEARHRFMAHRCETGMDNTIAELGSYGVEARLYEWLAYHSDPKVLAMLSPGPTNDYREEARQNFYSMQRYMFCLDPTPSAPPPELADNPLSGTPVWTAGIIRALQSGVPVPRLLEPAADADAPGRGAVFTWQAVDFSGGAAYGIEVDEFFQYGKAQGYWRAVADDAGLAGLRYVLPVGFNTGYAKLGRWRVWAISPTAGAGPKSEWRYFKIVS